MGIGEIIKEELNWGKTANGETARVSTANCCLDFFGRIGGLRGNVSEQISLFRKAYAENPEIAIKLLFYTRDIREGYGERSAFTEILKDLANREPLTVVKNLPYIMEFGYFKDLYCLLNTKCERAMFEEMKNQWNKDLANLKEGKEVSLLAKWIATDKASSKRVAHLAVRTAYGLGYDKYTIKKFRKDLTALREKLNITERYIAQKEYNKIDYSKIPSKCGLVHRAAFKKYDGKRYAEYIESVNKGETKINTETLTPVDIIHKALNSNMYNKRNARTELDTMWENLTPPKKDCNVLCIVDTSGSMLSGRGSVKPIEASVAMGLYIAEHNTGDLKNLIMTFSEEPEFVSLNNTGCLLDRIDEIEETDWGNSTNLEAAYEELLELAKNNNIPEKDMPEAIVIISDMQINQALENDIDGERIDFHKKMKNMYEAEGYKMPHTVFWNVNASKATFLAARAEDSVSLVSGYSPNIFNQILDNIGTTPEQLMMNVVNSERYSMIHAYEAKHINKQKTIEKVQNIEAKNKEKLKIKEEDFCI